MWLAASHNLHIGLCIQPSQCSLIVLSFLWRLWRCGGLTVIYQFISAMRTVFTDTPETHLAIPTLFHHVPFLIAGQPVPSAFLTPRPWQRVETFWDARMLHTQIPTDDPLPVSYPPKSAQGQRSPFSPGTSMVYVLGLVVSILSFTANARSKADDLFSLFDLSFMAILLILFS